jgi:hypothetical protein
MPARLFFNNVPEYYSCTWRTGFEESHEDRLAIPLPWFKVTRGTISVVQVPTPEFFDVPFNHDPDQPLGNWEESSCLAEIVLAPLSAQALRISSSPHFQ